MRGVVRGMMGAVIGMRGVRGGGVAVRGVRGVRGAVRGVRGVRGWEQLAESGDWTGPSCPSLHTPHLSHSHGNIRLVSLRE